MRYWFGRDGRSTEILQDPPMLIPPPMSMLEAVAEAAAADPVVVDIVMLDKLDIDIAMAVVS
jgi:hypothetical protein